MDYGRERPGDQIVHKMHISNLELIAELWQETLLTKAYKVITIMKTPHVWAKSLTSASAVLFYGPSLEHNQGETRAGGHQFPEARLGQGHLNVWLSCYFSIVCLVTSYDICQHGLHPFIPLAFVKTTITTIQSVPFSLPVTFHFQGDEIRSLQVLISQLFQNKDCKA